VVEEQAFPVHWLTSAEMAAWLPLITVAMRLPAALDTQLRADSALTHFEFLVMANLSQAPDRSLGLSALAYSANASPSRLSHVIAKLGEAGWLERRSEGRTAVAVLTDAGFAALDAAARGHVAEVRRRIFDHLDEADVEDLVRILPKLAGPLAPDCGLVTRSE
jgi:DNA-binding MarR family transcriptional regulator